jgi:hypothetical protein
LHSQSAVIAQRLLSDFRAIAHRLHNYCASIARDRNAIAQYRAIEEQLYSDRSAIPQGFKSDCAATAMQRQSDYKIIVQQWLQAFAKRLQNNRITIARRFPSILSECKVMAKFV